MDIDIEGYSLECIKNERKLLGERRQKLLEEERRLTSKEVKLISIEVKLATSKAEKLRTFEWTRGLTAKLAFSIGTTHCNYQLMIDTDVVECPFDSFALVDKTHVSPIGKDCSLYLTRQRFFSDKWAVETRSLEMMLEFISKSHFESIEYDKKLRMLFDRIDMKYFSMGIPRVNRPYPEL